MFHALFGLHRQRHDVFLLFLSCSARDGISADVSQGECGFRKKRLVDKDYRSHHLVPYHQLIVNEVEWIVGIFRLLLPDAYVQHFDEVSLWWILHVEESLRNKQNCFLWFMCHKEI